MVDPNSPHDSSVLKGRLEEVEGGVGDGNRHKPTMAAQLFEHHAPHH